MTLTLSIIAKARIVNNNSRIVIYSFIVLVTLIMIVNYNRTVIMIVYYDHKTFLVQATILKFNIRFLYRETKKKNAKLLQKAQKMKNKFLLKCLLNLLV